jgi:hypothetical protein
MKKYLLLILTILILLVTPLFAKPIFAAITSSVPLGQGETVTPPTKVANDASSNGYSYYAFVSSGGKVNKVYITDAGGTRYSEATENYPEVKNSTLNEAKGAVAAENKSGKIKETPFFQEWVKAGGEVIGEAGGAAGEAAKAAIKKLAGPAPSGCFRPTVTAPFFHIDLVSCAAEFSNRIIMPVAAFILWLAALFFNFTLSASLNMGQFISDVPIIEIGWKLFRDLANLCFIFILLYIAINTILQTKGADTKRLLIRVIMVALLLNFSLFFTKVVIDASNILALQFYEQMGGAGTGPNTGIAGNFIEGLKLETLYKGDEPAEGEEGKPPAGRNILIVSLGGAGLIIVTAFVFIVAALLFVSRTVILIFLMVLAPVAFLAMVLPKTEGRWKEWLETLLKESFFAPLYMMMIYLVVRIIAGGYGKDGTASLADLLKGNDSSVGTLYTFMVLIALMLGSLVIAKTFSTKMGDITRKAIGGGLVSSGAWLGRRTAGRLGNSIANSGLVNNWATSDNVFARSAGRTLRNVGDAAGKGTFDLRNAPGGLGKYASDAGLGSAGGKGGYVQIQKDAQKKIEENKKKYSALTSGEESSLAGFEKKRDDLQTLQSAALLREKEEKIEERRALKPQKDAAEADISSLNKQISDERKKYGTASTDEEKKKIKDNIDVLAGQIAEKREAVEAYNAVDSSVKKIDGDISGINKDYNKDGKYNDEVIRKIQKKARELEDVKNRKNVDGFSSSNSSEEINRHLATQIASGIKQVEGQGKGRGTNYMKLDLADKLGLTTARKAALRKEREDDRKDGNKKLLEQIKKLAKDDDSSGGSGDKKDDKEGDKKEDKK